MRLNTDTLTQKLIQLDKKLQELDESLGMSKVEIREVLWELIENHKKNL